MYERLQASVSEVQKGITIYDKQLNLPTVAYSICAHKTYSYLASNYNELALLTDCFFRPTVKIRLLSNLTSSAKTMIHVCSEFNAHLTIRIEKEYYCHLKDKLCYCRHRPTCCLKLSKQLMTYELHLEIIADENRPAHEFHCRGWTLELLLQIFTSDVQAYNHNT